MKIKVCAQNRDKISGAISEVQSKARTRTISADTITDYCESLADSYRMIPKKALHGSTFSVDPFAQHFPNAYKGIPESTQFSLLYSHGQFYLTRLVRDRTKSESLTVVANLSEDAQVALLTAFTYPTKYGI